MHSLDKTVLFLFIRSHNFTLPLNSGYRSLLSANTHTNTARVLSSAGSSKPEHGSTLYHQSQRMQHSYSRSRSINSSITASNNTKGLARPLLCSLCSGRYRHILEQGHSLQVLHSCSYSKLNCLNLESRPVSKSRSSLFSKHFRCQKNEECRTQSTRSQDTVMNIFDRKAKRLQRDRAALSYVEEDVSVYDYLKDEFGYRLSDRVCDIKRVFKTAADLGCGRGHLSKNVYSDMVECLFQCELSAEMLMCAEPSPEVPTHKLIVDEEFLPFKDNSLDIVLSNLSLHWVNDLPRCLKQILLALKNDGVLVGNMFGGDTLYEMRVSLQLAEQEREGGFSPHISPYTTVNDLGNLLTRAGYTMLTIDIDDVTINYPSMFELMYDLKGMAENNCAWRRKPQLHRDTLIAAASIYKEMYGNDQGVPATFQVINFIGWKPDASQPKAAKRGSATVSIKDIGRLDELTKQMEGVQKTKQPSEATKEKIVEDLQALGNKYEDPENTGGKK